MLCCFKMPKLLRNKVVPAEETGIYTITLSSTSTLATQDAVEELSTLHPNKEASAMKSRGHSLWWHVAVDVPIVLIVITILTLMELGVLPFHRSGFYCKDPALAFPFTGDTVSMGFLVSSVIFFPLIMLWSVEAVLHRPNEYPIKTSRLKESLKNSSVWYRDYIYGSIINLFIAEVMKLTIGNPRPTFFAICNPDALATCNGTEYVKTFTCTPSAEHAYWFQLDASRSFPSGHTSLSVHAGLFVAWYLQKRCFSWRNPTMFAVPLLQLLCVGYACVCSLTRITDHRHHWWDVLTGFVIGVATAFYAVMVLSKNFACSTTVSSSDISNSDSGGHNHHSVRRLLSSGSADHTSPLSPHTRITIP